jgi:hypothetical protein
MTYPGYLDADTGKTLTCVPGSSYDIVPAGGTASDVPTDGRFTVTPVTVKDSSTKAAKNSAPSADQPEGGEE